MLFSRQIENPMGSEKKKKLRKHLKMEKEKLS